MTPARALTLGFHATSRGFGYALLEDPFTVVEAAQFDCPGRNKNPRCLSRVATLIERVRPETIVLEAFDRASSLRSNRIRSLCLAVVAHAAGRGLEIMVHSRADVREAFATVGARTRDEIAEAALRCLPALQAHYPGRRKAWQSEDRRLSIFSAAALVLTHYHFGANRIFDQTRRAA